jgi:phage protein D
MARPEPDQLQISAVEVVINGTSLPPEDAVHVESATVDHDTGLPGMFAVRLIGSHDLGKEIPWVDDDLFAVGNAVELKLGYLDDLETVIVGEITGLEPEFRQDRLPSLTVRGFDRLHRLQRGRRTRTFIQQKDSDVASQIANDAGLTPQVEDSSVTHDYLLQANQTDFEFLRERARRISYEVSVEDRTLMFQPVKNADGAALTLTLGAELAEIHLRLSSVGLAGEVSVRGWSAKDKKEIVGQAKAGDESSTMEGQQSGPAVAEGAFGAAVQTLSAWPAAIQAEADQVAKARFNRAALGFVTGEGVCGGRTDLRVGLVIGIAGVGTRFSGAYYVTSVSHRYTAGGGFETRFSVRRNAS